MSKIKLKIGYRAGWPGTKMAEYVTHAVYKVGGGKTKGYGKSNNKGEIVDDSIASPNSTYKWVGQVLLQEDSIQIFEAEVAKSAAALVYTGVLANCYSPIIDGLYAVRTFRQSKDRTGNAAVELDRILTTLLGQNYGMGYGVTNLTKQSGYNMFHILTSSVSAFWNADHGELLDELGPL